MTDSLSLFMGGPYRTYLHELWGLKRAVGHLYVLAGDASQFTGSGQHMLSPTAGPEEIVGALSTLRPELLSTYPSVAASAACESARRGIDTASLRVVQLTGEPLTRPVFRSIMRGFPRARIVDTYTAGEFGLVAFQCRPGGPYHVPDTRMVVEVLKPDGRPAGPGQGGRVVITDLASREEPLIRYTGLGDWAVRGDRCGCGLLWPTLQRIDGPVSSWFVMEDGRRIASFDLMDAMEDVQGVRHYQLVQEQKDLVEVRVVMDGRGRSQVEQVEAEVEAALNPVFKPFAIRIGTTLHPVLPRDPGSGRTSVVVNQVM
jgi:phenylacetate-CoA ligase